MLKPAKAQTLTSPTNARALRQVHSWCIYLPLSSNLSLLKEVTSAQNIIRQGIDTGLNGTAASLQRKEMKRGVTNADKQDEFAQQVPTLQRQPGPSADAKPPCRPDSGKEILLSSHLGRLPTSEIILDSKIRLCCF